MKKDSTAKTIRASIGSLGVLGLRNIKLPAPPTTLYLMLGEKCMFDCAYCPQAHTSHGSTDFLSRVIWPKIDWELLKNAVLKAPEIVKRACFQVVSSKGYVEEALFFVQDLSRTLSEAKESGNNLRTLPISVSIRLSNISDVKRLFDAGAERIGLAMDVVSRDNYANIRGGDFDRDFHFILSAGERFKGRITTHIIVGMGETDEELFNAFSEFYKRDITVGLFAFTPIKGTRMENAKRPSLNRYRKVQFMRYLFSMNKGFVPHFDENGKLISIEGESVGNFVKNGAIYMTSGCPNCNRPYYNEEPLGPMFNYPFIPDETERIVNEFTEKVERNKVVFRE